MQVINSIATEVHVTYIKTFVVQLISRACMNQKDIPYLFYHNSIFEDSMGFAESQGSHVQNPWYYREVLFILNTHAKYGIPISNGAKVMDKVKVVSQEGQRSRSRSHVKNSWYHRESLVIRKTHAKYERPISYS